MVKKQPDNGNEQTQAIIDALETLSNRIGDLEEEARRGDNNAKIQLAGMYFKPEDRYLSDMSFISPIAAKPLAEAMALDMMTNEDVRSGKTSINMELIRYWLHIQRGVRGRLMGIGKEALVEQISGEAGGEEEMPEFRAGGD